jgi:type I restriction enzyme S subunit
MKNKTTYKKTDLGVIPSDWEIKRLGDCLIKKPDYGINAAAVDYDDTLPTYLRITDISESGKYLSLNKVSINNIYATSYYLEKGDIVFARTGASVGKTYLYDINDGQLVFAGFLIRVKANPATLSPNYLIYLTQTKSYWSWVTANSMRSGQPGLNSSEFMSFPIPLPPTLTEQTAIANTLSDADALITSLEKLIAKKRNIKQGAMQKLLQPKEGWEVKRLGEIAEVRDGTHQTPTYVDSGIPFYSVESITNNDFKNTKYITEEAHKLLTKTFRIEKGDILMTRIGSIGDCKLVDWDVNASFYVSLSLLKIKSGNSAEYICHYSKTASFKKEADINSLQSAIPKKI